MNIHDFTAILMLVIYGLLILVGSVFFISGVDDFFIDICYTVRRIYRKFFVMTKYSPLSEGDLLLPDEQLIAILIPTWDESKVIRRMLENNLTTLNYSNYHFFVGTYPNDLATQREVEFVREHFDNVQRIVCPKDGPTNKADCLNWIYQGIKHFESEHKMKFEIFVMHDSEDIIHPLSLKLFNYLIPRKDMVQLPVFPLEPKWFNFTAGHYIDEFSESHFKDLVVREFLSKKIPLPSAGVGCAFSRRALETVGGGKQKQLFSIDSLTEDYDFGFRINEFGLKQIFVNHAIERVTTKRSFFTGKPKKVKVKEYIATRGYFPHRFWAAVRQKSRWMVGITLQGWASLGWKGNLWTKYMLFRDRKSLVTNQINFLGYIVLIAVLVIWLTSKFFPESYHYPPLVNKGSFLWYLILGATFFLFVRTFQQFYFVHHYYGYRQAFLAIPRRVWGNILNFAATTRAIYLYIRFLNTGKLISWDKTDHVFPSEKELISYRRKLGDLLLERRFITVEQLDKALELQKKRNLPLGAVLIDMGHVKEDDLIQVLGLQIHISTKEIDPYEVPLDTLQAVPRSIAVKYSVFPVEINENNKLVVATNNLLSFEQVKRLRQALDRPVEICLATKGDVSFAIRRGYERLEGFDGAEPQDSYLGQLLLKHSFITSQQLQKALKVQRQSYIRLGDVLLQEGMMSSQTLNESLRRYKPDNDMPFGEYLIQNNYISKSQLKRALEIQSNRFRLLGDVMVELQIISKEKLREVLKEQTREN